MSNIEKAKLRAQAVRTERFLRRIAEKENREIVDKIRESLYNSNPELLRGVRI